MSVRVAVCGGAPASARELKRFFEVDDDIEAITVATAGEALVADLVRLRPDLVAVNLAAGNSVNVETIQRIVGAQRAPVVVVSDDHALAAHAVAAALDAGALEALRRSDVADDDRGSAKASALRRRMVRLTHSAVRAQGRNGHVGDRHHAVAPAVIGIGASTGGPTALRTVLGALPADFPVPILVVQHMVAGFNAGLASWLNDIVSIPVSLAVAGRGLTAGVLIAPDEAHLVVSAGGRIQLDTRTPGNPHRPSADMLLQSLARTYGPRVMAVVLTGMGVDGAAGVQSVIAAGGEAITEPAGAATLWAMPAAAAAAGATVVGLDAIGRELVSVAGRR